MQSPTVIRNWQIDQLRKNIRIIGRAIETADPQEATTYRDGGDGWTVLEVMCHLRDFEQVFLDRLCLTVDEEFPDLPVPNPDLMAQENNYMAQHLDAAYAEWTQRRNALLGYVATLGDDAWAREAKHPVRGSMSLNDQIMLTVYHDNNHLEQIVKILAEKK
jgi:uncharacterized damage-inducible protein DinB